MSALENVRDRPFDILQRERSVMFIKKFVSLLYCTVLYCTVLYCTVYFTVYCTVANRYLQ